ncbi:Exopolyphosphatase [Pirellulimonas nuda]|uniref:Exopolyphosphatase n=1 Tax=Pirellulimonas nuda TaxID=2528009 RepID=A0A518D7U5_9BACT|nr:Ppx/GppA phosphatase family protein [Pirellulimonas nuda]QDU87529.1 Exopolyphosphatase [Pirellulimonas nuda]
MAEPAASSTISPTPVAVGDRIAAIDIGSNSVRVVVAEVLEGDGYRVVDEERENTRLAASLSETGRLSPTAMDATLAALGSFATMASGQGVKRVRAIATSAVRDAANGQEFCQRVYESLGLKVEVISAREEARLAFMSVARAFDVAGREVAIADIGGGSTEIVLASSGMIDQCYATRLGAVRVSEDHGLCGAVNEEQLREASDAVDRQLRRHAKKPSFEPEMLYGTGGTFTAMASMLIGKNGGDGSNVWGYRAGRVEILHLLTDLSQLPLEKRKKVSGLNPQRADIIVGGLLVIERIMSHLKVNTVQVHTRGVRDGVLLTMVRDGRSQGKPVPPEARRDAVELFAKSCGVDLTHARQVARIAARLLEQLAEPLGLDPADRELMETAAILSNVGYLINFDKHHKHSYQLILNSELSGFERRELQLVANIARYHRGSHPKKKHEGYAELGEEDRERVAQLAAILRLALALDRTHQQQVADLACAVSEGRVEIAVSSRENAEGDLWAARRKVDLFEKVFRRQVVFAEAG